MTSLKCQELFGWLSCGMKPGIRNRQNPPALTSTERPTLLTPLPEVCPHTGRSHGGSSYLLREGRVPELEVLLGVGQDGLQGAPQVVLVEALGRPDQRGQGHGHLHLHPGKVLQPQRKRALPGRDSDARPWTIHRAALLLALRRSIRGALVSRGLCPCLAIGRSSVHETFSTVLQYIHVWSCNQCI